MYYSDNIKVRITDYSELSKYNHLPTGAIVIVENPIPHKWMRIEGAWINMNQYEMIRKDEKECYKDKTISDNENNHNKNQYRKIVKF